MKRLCVGLVCLCLMISPLAALAAVGDATLFPENSGELAAALGALDGCFFIATDQDLYRLQPGEGTPTPLSFEEREGYLDIKAILADGERLFMLLADHNQEGMVRFCQIRAEGDRVAFEQRAALDLRGLMLYEDDDYAYLPRLRCAGLAGDFLAMLVYDQSYDRGALYRYDLVSGQGTPLDVKGVPVMVAPYLPGQALVVSSVSDNWSEPGALWVLDIASGQLTELGRLACGAYYACALAWDPDAGLIYYGDGIQLNAATPQAPDAVNRVCALNTRGIGNPSPQGILLDGYFAALTYGGVLVRNTDPAAQPEKTIVVASGSGYSKDEFYQAFAASNPQVDVVYRADMDSQTLTQALMNRSAEADLYQINAVSDAYRAMRERGYLIPVEDEVVRAAVARMYPQVQSLLSSGGQVAAVPVSANARGMEYNKQVVKKLGLTEPELPGTWSEMIDFAAGWSARFGEAFPEVTMFAPYMLPEIRLYLTQMILEDYMAYLEMPGRAIQYDTRLLRELLEKLEQADLSGIETEPRTSGSYEWLADSVLFDSGNMLSGWDNNNVSWPVALSPGEEPVLGMDVEVLVINPFTRNRAEAEAYLASVVSQYDDSVKARLMPGENEPVRTPDYEYSLKNHEEWMEHLETMLDEAEPEDKQRIEDLYQEELNYWQDYENTYSWSLTAEQIAAYRVSAKNLAVITGGGLGEKSRMEMYELIKRFAGGELKAVQFLKTLDQKVQMMMMEGY